MTAARRPISVASVWAWMSSGVGYHLDNFGRWLIVRAPRLGAAYAALWTPGPPKLGPRPGWGFAEEFYDQRQWLACRRGALWEAARDNNLVVRLSVPWLAGTTVDVTLGNDNSLCLYVCGSFEPNEFNFLDRMLKPGMVFVDVGANDGYYTLFAVQRVGPKGRVVSVEPSSREREHLERNLARNSVSNVEIVPAALGAAAGHAELHLAHGVHTGHNTLGQFAHDDVVSARVERVPLETLDSVVARLGLSRVDVVKIDVEGGEANVIAGARNVLRAMRPALMMEVSDGALRAQMSSQVSLLATLQGELEYEVLTFSQTTGLARRWVEGEPLSANIVVVPRERAKILLKAQKRTGIRAGEDDGIS